MSILISGLLSLGVLAVFGLGLFLTLMEVRKVRRDRERHVDVMTGAKNLERPGDSTDVVNRMAASSLNGILGRRLRPVFGVGLSRTWGMSAGASALIPAAAGGAGVTWLVLHSGLHMSAWIAPPATLAAFFLAPRALLKHQQNGADKRFMEAFPESIDMVIRMLRAGLPITAAVRAVGSEAPPPVNAVFTRIADAMAIGIPFEDALTSAAQRVGLSDFLFFAVAISLQRATGGNLIATLEILSDIMRKRRAMRMKARATTGEVRMSAYVLGGIPFFIIGGLLIMTPDYLRPLITDRRGNAIIAAAVISLLIGFGTIRQMMRSVTNAT